MTPIKYILIVFLLSGAWAIKAQKVIVYDRYEDMANSLFKQNDTTYVINFWATWCKPCVKELPYFENLHLKSSDQKIKVLLVSLDFRKQLESKLIPFLEKEKIQSPTFLLDDKDYDRWLGQVDPLWSGSIPSTLIIRGKEKIFTEQEFESYEDIKKYVDNFINNH